MGQLRAILKPERIQMKRYSFQEGL